MQAQYLFLGSHDSTQCWGSSITSVCLFVLCVLPRPVWVREGHLCQNLDGAEQAWEPVGGVHVVLGVTNITRCSALYFVMFVSRGDLVQHLVMCRGAASVAVYFVS